MTWPEVRATLVAVGRTRQEKNAMPTIEGGCLCGAARYRFFCGDCGSHIYSHGPAYGAIAFIKAGTLDDPSWVAPNLHIWCAEKLPWVDIPAGVTQATL